MHTGMALARLHTLALADHLVQSYICQLNTLSLYRGNNSFMLWRLLMVRYACLSLGLFYII